MARGGSILAPPGSAADRDRAELSGHGGARPRQDSAPSRSVCAPAARCEDSSVVLSSSLAPFTGFGVALRGCRSALDFLRSIGIPDERFARPLRSLRSPRAAARSSRAG